MVLASPGLPWNRVFDLVLTALAILRCAGQGFCRMPLTWGLLDVFLLVGQGDGDCCSDHDLLYILLPSPEIKRAWRHRTGSFLSSKGEGGGKGQVLEGMATGARRARGVGEAATTKQG